jgi:hypothetical protein
MPRRQPFQPRRAVHLDIRARRPHFRLIVAGFLAAALLAALLFGLMFTSSHRPPDLNPGFWGAWWE